MANRSTFTATNGYTPDSFSELFDLSPAQLVQAQRYQTLKMKSNKTTDEITEYNGLVVALQDYLITSERWNHFQDALVSMQVFIKSNVEGYITTKQNEFNAKIDKFSDKGVYSSATTYQATNFVTYQEETYICLVDNTIGIPPTDTSKWRKAAPRGSKGDAGLSATYKGEYNSITSYVVGESVSYQGIIYYAKTAVSGIAPTDNSKWQLFDKLVIDSSAPSAPTINQAWLDTSNKKIKYWDGFTWIENKASDSDKLGGQLPSYYATNQSVTDTNNKLGLLTNLTTIDKSSLVASNNEIKSSLATHTADYLQFKQDTEIMYWMGAI